MYRPACPFRSRLTRRVFALAVIVSVLCGVGFLPVAVATAEAGTSDPIVGDWNVTYGAPAVVTMTLSNGVYTVTAKTPVEVTGATCFLPVGTVIATFSATGPNTYSGQHGLWYTSDCSFGYWDPMTLTLSSDGQTLTGVLAGGYGTVVFTKISTVSSGGVYAFGDSIAAGYGMPGLSNGTGNDNPYAYPALLAQALNLSYRNFASAGACANPSDAVDPLSQSVGYCNTAGIGQIPLTAQIKNAPLTPVPSLVTVTVGGNDIDFQNCIQAVVLGTYNDPKQDPCEPKTNLPANLQALTSSLTYDLTTLQKMYPGVPILITGYFNPFPSGSEALCNFDAAVGTWLYIKYYLDHDPHQLAHGIENIFIRPDAFVSGLQSVQDAIYHRATYVLNHLDSTLSSVAGSLPGVSFAPVNFAGHDFCQAQNAWIFGPNISASLSLHHGGSTYTLTYNTSPLVCPNPTSLELSYGINPSLPLPGGNSAAFGLNLTTNCMPHPTQIGQEQLTSQIYPVAKQLLPSASSLIEKPRISSSGHGPERLASRTNVGQRLAA